MNSRFASLAAVLSVVGLMAWLALSTPGGQVGEGQPSDGVGVAPGQAQAIAGRGDGKEQIVCDRSTYACQVPLLWRVVRLDTEFGLTAAEARTAVEEAAALWNHAAGRRLISYDSLGGHPIRFVFDERQRRTQERILAEAEFREVGRVLDERRRELQERELELETAGDELKDEWERLSRSALKHQELGVELERRFPLLPVESGLYREAVREEEGCVVVMGREILVFRFDDRRDLVRVLAHELGHALGLGHDTNPGSIMSQEYGRPGLGGVSAGAVIGPGEVERWKALCSEP